MLEMIIEAIIVLGLASLSYFPIKKFLRTFNAHKVLTIDFYSFVSEKMDKSIVGTSFVQNAHKEVDKYRNLVKSKWSYLYFIGVSFILIIVAFVLNEGIGYITFFALWLFGLLCYTLTPEVEQIKIMTEKVDKLLYECYDIHNSSIESKQ